MLRRPTGCNCYMLFASFVVSIVTTVTIPHSRRQHAQTTTALTIAQVSPRHGCVALWPSHELDHIHLDVKGHRFRTWPAPTAILRDACLVQSQAQGQGHSYGWVIEIVCTKTALFQGWLTRWGLRIRCVGNRSSTFQVREEVAGVVWPAFPKHVTHFVDSLALHISAFFNKRAFPQWANMTKVLVLSPKAGELPYNVQYATLVGKLWGVPVVWKEDIIAPTCLKYLLVAGSLSECLSASNSVDTRGAGPVPECRFFGNPRTAELWRQTVFSHYQIPMQDTTPYSAPIRVLVVNRRAAAHPGRRITNIEEVLKFMAAQHWIDQSHLHRTSGTDLAQLEFKDQVQLFADADVVIGVHGSGLGNVHFMRLFSTLIEIEPAPMMEMWWAQISTASGILFDALIPEYSATPCTARPKSIVFNPSAESLKSCDPSIDIPRLEVALVKAAMYTRVWKRRNKNILEFGTRYLIQE